MNFLLWSANIVLSKPHFPPVFSPLPRFVALRVFRLNSHTSRFCSVAHCSLDFSPFPFLLRRGLLARLPVRHVSVLSHVARSTSCVSFVSLCVERIEFSAPLLLLSGTFVLDDLFCSSGGLFYRLFTVCCVWCLFWVCFAWLGFIWSLHTIDNRV